MISTELARALRDSGLTWHPGVGDAFCIDRVEVDGEIFILSDMTVEAHEFSTGTVLGFNGTTEWALDSVSLDDALWLPREGQLRDLLRATFRSLEAIDGGFRVSVVFDGKLQSFEAPGAADAYARALITLIDDSLGDPFPDLEDELPTV
ncbi:pilus assembly protein CpaE [Glaciihabitans sp. dw_435]|uniref:pilus assembly protein CpaE n=1 Tax=Glaciihabitans sp. dw_435 TaxID=2720081 RepID=UPI001BD4073D|nr:pilus assembly protein CpaE [Glaciihabitans sp. dw_435]